MMAAILAMEISRDPVLKTSKQIGCSTLCSHALTYTLEITTCAFARSDINYIAWPANSVLFHFFESCLSECS